ncbi:hypothetical protein F5148DRAFT_1280551 [Russula earlei]|uniref:Uncharacterized protein n=1 Tax=Russula earlei TaxID=71964 RepID=A0ACC0UJ84_9AGAM|nr:hypothetical protein F5148DRAFT_1280551 [Russula earlei]
MSSTQSLHVIKSLKLYVLIASLANASYKADIQAYNRIKTWKFKIASSILTEIQKFFDKMMFCDKPEKICEYVCWALSPNGPAYYKMPTQECRVDWMHSDYLPDGFLPSEFVAPITAKYLSYAKNSILHLPLNAKHLPKGLYVLIMTAVERAFKAHMNGRFDPP